MNVNIKVGNLKAEKVDTIIFTLFEGVRGPVGELKKLDEALEGQLSLLLSDGNFNGKPNETLLVHTAGRIPAKRLYLVGIGLEDEFVLDSLRQAAGVISRMARNGGSTEIAFAVIDHKRILPSDAAQSIVEGVALANYEFGGYKTKKEDENKVIKNLIVFGTEHMSLAELRSGAKLGQTISDAVNLVRNLVNEPANVMNPTRFAAETQKIAKQVRLKFHALGVPEMKKLGMNLLLSVAAGSDQPPKFIILDHHGSKRKGTDIVLIGKGITFDSGGISIKPSEGMEKMKYDMAGAAAVVGTMKAAAEMRLPLNLVGLIPVTENMPSGKASRPGDIVTGMNGKSVEIINTDAEGRLVLADALTYAEKYQPKAVVDLATLTGACVVALGEHAIGMMGNHQKIMDVLKFSGEVAHERVWQLPLWDDYFEQIKSDNADVKNTGGRWGGAITAALFLKQFAEKFHWAHLDIAGTAWIEKDRPYCPKGATGTGVRLMIQFLQDYLDKTI